MSKDLAGRADTPTGNPEIGEAEKRAVADRLLKSKTFSASPRLCDFLRYVTEEAILGRGADIRAKSIALSVYERTSVDEMTSANVVRVEARRLRRLLEDYYENEGSADPVRIHIDKGGYAPRFEQQAVGEEPSPPASQEAPAPPPRERKFNPVQLAIGIAVAVVLAAALYLTTDTSQAPDQPNTARLERQALMERSPAALEAANLVNQARGLIYPVFDANRQRLTAELFRAAIEIDPNSAGAHAGAAQTLASLALLSIDGPQHDAHLSEAYLFLERALALAPTDAWTQSAAGWVAFVARDYDNSARYSERALSLAPEDGNILDFYGVIAIFTGEFEKAAAAADRERERTGPNTRFAFLNILAAARFHQGDLAEAIRLIEESNATGGPLSAPGVFYLAAAYQSLGRTDDGLRMMKLLEQSWPDFPVERFIRRLHKSESEALKVIHPLQALGWNG